MTSFISNSSINNKTSFLSNGGTLLSSNDPNPILTNLTVTNRLTVAGTTVSQNNIVVDDPLMEIGRMNENSNLGWWGTVKKAALNYFPSIIYNKQQGEFQLTDATTAPSATTMPGLLNGYPSGKLRAHGLNSFNAQIGEITSNYVRLNPTNGHANKILTIYDPSPLSDKSTATDFMGLGHNSSTFRYQTGHPLHFHRFYAGATELMSLTDAQLTMLRPLAISENATLANGKGISSAAFINLRGTRVVTNPNSEDILSTIMNTAGTRRWSIKLRTAEVAGNAEGSDLQFQGFSDDGNAGSCLLSMSRKGLFYASGGISTASAIECTNLNMSGNIGTRRIDCTQLVRNGNLSWDSKSVNSRGIFMNSVASAFTDTAATLSGTTLSFNHFATPTVSPVMANQTYASAATVAIQGPPTMSNGATTTFGSPYALFVESGNSRFVGDVSTNKLNATTIETGAITCSSINGAAMPNHYEEASTTWAMSFDAGGPAGGTIVSVPITFCRVGKVVTMQHAGFTFYNVSAFNRMQLTGLPTQFKPPINTALSFNGPLITGPSDSTHPRRVDVTSESSTSFNVAFYTSWSATPAPFPIGTITVKAGSYTWIHGP